MNSIQNDFSMNSLHFLLQIMNKKGTTSRNEINEKVHTEPPIERIHNTNSTVHHQI